MNCMIGLLAYINERVTLSLLEGGVCLNDTEMDTFVTTTLRLYSQLDQSETNFTLLLQRFELCRDLTDTGYNIPSDVIAALFFQGLFQDPSFPAQLTGEYRDITADSYVDISLIKTDAYGDFIDSVRALIRAAHQGQAAFDDHKSALLLDINNSFLAGERNDYLASVTGIARKHLTEGVKPDSYAATRTTHLNGVISRNFIFHTDPFSDDYDVKARENMRWEIDVIEDVVKLAGQIKRASQALSPQHRTHLLTP